MTPFWNGFADDQHVLDPGIRGTLILSEGMPLGTTKGVSQDYTVLVVIKASRRVPRVDDALTLA